MLPQAVPFAHQHRYPTLPFPALEVQVESLNNYSIVFLPTSARYLTQFPLLSLTELFTLSFALLTQNYLRHGIY